MEVGLLFLQLNPLFKTWSFSIVAGGNMSMAVIRANWAHSTKAPIGRCTRINIQKWLAATFKRTKGIFRPKVAAVFFLFLHIKR